MTKKLLLTISLLGITCLVLLGMAGMIMASEIEDTLPDGLESGYYGVVMTVPTAYPVAGTFSSAQTVTLTASGATAVCYTTSVSDPVCAAAGSSCTTGNPYSSAISVPSTTTIRARSCYPNSNSSSISSHTYTINIPAPPGGGGGSTPSSILMPVTTTGQVTATASGGGKTTLTTPEGIKVTVELPAGAVASNTIIKIEKVEIGTIIITAPTPTGKTIVSSFNITATTVAGTPVTSFAKSATITITYTDAQIAGLNESGLKIYRWDGTQWVALSSTVNTATNTITATTTSFSYFAVMGAPLSVVPEITPPTKPYAEMTDEELQVEIAKLMALIVQLQAQVAQLQAGGVTTTVPSLCIGVTFNRNLSQGMVGDDIKCLQVFLNQSVDTRIAVSGVGSPGNETNYFGALTKVAVIKFQEKYTSEILTPVNLTAGTGFVGASTRAKLNALLGM